MAFDPNAPVDLLDAPAKAITFNPDVAIELPAAEASFYPNESVEIVSPRENLEQVGGIPKGLSPTQRAARERLFQKIGLDPKSFAQPLVGYGEAKGTLGTIPAIPDLPATSIPGIMPFPIPADVQAGAVNAVAPAVASFTSPENITIMLATAGTGKLVQRLVAGGFGVHMIKSAIDAVPEAATVLDDPKVSRQKKVETVGGILTNLLLGTAAGSHALRSGVKGTAAIENPKEAVPKTEGVASGFSPDKPIEAVVENPVRLPEVEKPTGKLGPVVEEPVKLSDREQYDALQAQMKALGADKSETPEYQKIWQVSEEIKNRNGGMPPGEVAADAANLDEILGIPKEDSTIPKSEPGVFKPDDPVQDVVPEEIKSGEVVPEEEQPAFLQPMMDRALDKAEKERKPERIISAAAQAPDGTIYTGKWHPAAYEEYMSATGKTREQVISELQGGTLKDGFTTSEGRFVDRDEAAKVANSADQFKPGKAGDVAFAGGLKGLEVGPKKITNPPAKELETVPAKPAEQIPVKTQNELPASRPLSAELKANNADLDLPPLSSMTREAKRAELEAAGIKTYRGKALDAINPAELSAAVGKVRRGLLTAEGEKPGIIAGSKAETWADEALRKKRGQLNAGIDPEQFAAYTIKGLANFERGLTEFSKWSVEMTKQFGDEIKPHLEKIFRATRELNEEGARAVGASPDELKAFLADYRNAPEAEVPESTPPSRAHRLLKGLSDVKDKAVDILTMHLAKNSAPKTSARSETSGNALVRYASASIAAPEVSRSFAGQVLGSNVHNAEFATKLGAVLVEDRLHGIKAGLLKQAEEARIAGDLEGQAEFQDLASQVTSIIGKENSPFKTEAEYRAALSDPKIQAAIERHKNTVMPLAEKQHADLGGRVSKPGPDTKAFVNLEPLDEAGDIPGGKKGGGASKGDLTTPFKKGSAFSKRAYGTADNYVLDYNEITRRMVSGNFEETAKRAMYDQLTKDGLAVILPPGETPPDIGGAPPRKIQIERRGLPGPGGSRMLVRNLWVDRSIYPEVIRAMNLDETFKGSGAQQLANVLNTIQIKGPVDGVLHIANILTSISGSQGGRSLISDLIRMRPGINIVDAISKVTMRARDVVKDSPEIRKQLAKLAEIGAGRKPHEGGRGMTRLIEIVDKAARLVRDDMYDNLVERGLAKDTEAGRREFVNQIGQYNSRLQGQLAAKLKETGLSPFIVAGQTFNRMGLRRITANPAIRTTTKTAYAQLRGTEVAGLVVNLVVVPMVLNYILNGKPMGRPGVPVGAIDTGKDDAKGRMIYVDPQQWTGVRRGLRLSGAGAVAAGIQKDEGTGRMVDDVAHEMIAGYLHPVAGPVVNLAATAVTGYNSSQYKQADKAKPGESQMKENAIAAAKQLNPLVEKAIEGYEKDGGAAGAVSGAMKTFKSAFGVKEATPITPIQQMRVAAGKFNDTLGIQRGSSGLPSPYADLNKALGAEDYDTAAEALETLLQSKVEAQPGNLSGSAKLAVARRAVAEFYNREARAPFTGNLSRERAFKATLDADQLQTYTEAHAARRQMATTVRKLLYRR